MSHSRYIDTIYTRYIIIINFWKVRTLLKEWKHIIKTPCGSPTFHGCKPTSLEGDKDSRTCGRNRMLGLSLPGVPCCSNRPKIAWVCCNFMQFLRISRRMCRSQTFPAWTNPKNLKITWDTDDLNNNYLKQMISWT